MAEPFDIFKMLKSPFTGIYWVKSLMIGLGIFAILVVGYAIYKAYIRPAPTTAQKAEQIVNYNYTPQQTFGCMRFEGVKK